MNSSSSSSTSESAAAETQLPSSSSPSPPLHPPPPRPSLQSPELQAEFLRECRSRFQFNGEDGEAQSPSPFTPYSPLPSPFSPTASSSSPSSSSSSSSSPSFDSRRARLSLSSPELISELKDPKSHSLRHVPTHKGVTTIFSGRGRGGVRVGRVSDPAPSASRTNQKNRH